MTKRPMQIDRRPSADQETEQAILRVQRTLCLMNAPHSYRLYDAATLLRQAALAANLTDGGRTSAHEGADDDDRQNVNAIKPGLSASCDS